MTGSIRFADWIRGVALVAGLLAGAIPALAEPRHGIAMYGDPALPPDFVSLPYANPDAPKGGRIVLGENGGFDSLNPFNAKGRSPAMVSNLTVETLLGRSFAEPFTMYGLLAESVETDEARSWVEFTLRPEARFADGSPVTVEDVLWSFETLGTAGQGNPRYLSAWAAVAAAEQTGPRSVRFTFVQPNRELPLILGLRPVLQKAQWQDRDFGASGLTVPIGSGPYRVGRFETGRAITFVRRDDWWGRDLPINRGRFNFDEVRIEYFGDGDIMFEGFKGGLTDVYVETNPARWAIRYDFPAVTTGQIVKAEIPHQRPSGIEGLAMNTRRPMFTDWRVRQAMIEAFDYEQINSILTGGARPRIASYYSHSSLGMEPGAPATGAELALLQPFAADLPPGTIDGYALPVTDGSGANRAGLRRAARLLEEAGWIVGGDGRLRDATGTPFAFEILLQTGQDEMEAISAIYIEALKRLGMEARITKVDSAQYVARTGAFDFDMTHFIRALSLSPGIEQKLYWGSAEAALPGSRNWPGITSPAVDAMIDTMLNARAPDEFTAATRALDRLLTAGRYVVPVGYSDHARLAHRRELHYPANPPLYGVWPGVYPETWWWQE